MRHSGPPTLRGLRPRNGPSDHVVGTGVGHGQTSSMSLCVADTMRCSPPDTSTGGTLKTSPTSRRFQGLRPGHRSILTKVVSTP